MGRSPTKHRMTGGTRDVNTTPQGQLIVDRQHNVEAPHPHPGQNGRLVPTRGLNLVMLTDGSTYYECDECGQLREKNTSIISHMTMHNSSHRSPDYDIKTLRQLVALATKYKELHVRGFAEKTAVEMNDLGYVTLHGKAWTASVVSQLYSRWKGDPRMRVRRVAKKAEVTPTPVDQSSRTRGHLVDFTTPTTTDERVKTIFKGMRDAYDIIITIAGRLDDLSRELSDLAPNVDPAELKLLREKAQRWDDLRASLR